MSLHSKKLFRFRALSSVFGLTFLVYGCGDLPPPDLDLQRSQALTFASDHQSLPGSYIVGFKAEGNRIQAHVNFYEEYRAHFPALQERYLAEPGVKGIHFLTTLDLQPYKLEGMPVPGLQTPVSDVTAARIARVDFENEIQAKEYLNAWFDRGEIHYAEPNYLSQPSQTDFEELSTQYENLNRWWYDAINLPATFQSFADEGHQSDERPLIAVLDSGVDYEHPALKDNIWINIDQNSADCKDDLHGCDTTTTNRGFLGNGTVYPFGTTGPGQSCFDKDANCSHGTHVAGIIGGSSSWQDDRGRYAAGVCPMCRIMVLKIVSQVGEQSGILDSSIIAAFKYVTLFRRQGSPAVRVINASFGKFVRSRTVGLLVRIMKDSNETLLIGAAGNEDTLTMEYPAAFSDAIAVSAVDAKLNKVGFSNFGRWVDISAPGHHILATVPGNTLETKSGTSMAAPMVAGVAGLLLYRYPDLSFTQLRQAILNSADPGFYSEDHEDGFNYTYYYPKIQQEDIRQPLLGNGLLDANSALKREVKANLPLFSDLDRVKPGCSTIGTDSELALGWLLLLLGSAPLLFRVYK